MAVALLGVLDLSIVTDQLTSMLTNCINTSPLWNPNNLPVNPGPSFAINVTGSAPETVRGLGGCQLSLYLFHVGEDKFQKNFQPNGQLAPGVPPVRFQPMSLDLYYLLTAFSEGDYVQEQQAMSIALRCFHENPIVRFNVAFGPQNVQEEFCLTMEVETTESLGRLWQAITSPLRLAAVYKVSVVFISPEAPAGPPAPHPKQISLSADPSLLPYAAVGQVIGTLRTVRYHSPDGTAAQPDIRSFDLSPATVAPGERFILYGAGLNQNSSHRVYLIMPDGTEREVTAWLVPFPAQTNTRFTLTLPATVGAPPTDAPPAGVYQVRVGSDAAQGDAQTIRSNTTPFSVAARVRVTAEPPILTGPGPFTLNGAGFVAGNTEVLLDTVPLRETGGAPGAGEFNVTGAAITFRPPGNLAPGRYAVRIRVNQIESAPAWWLQV